MKNIFFKLSLGLSGLFLTVGTALAQVNTDSQVSGVCQQAVTNLGDLLVKIVCFLKAIIPVIIILGIVFFIWAVIQYLLNESNEKKRQEARAYILWAIIGLFVIVSIWGLVGILVNTFGFQNGNTILIPQVQEA